MAMYFRRTILLGLKSLRPQSYSTNSGWRNYGKLPLSFDWTGKGVLPIVGNQRQCSSCWAFTVAGTIESSLRIFNGISVELSKQELLDRCTNLNANGGWLHAGFEYVQRHGLSFESDYPYLALHRYPHYEKMLGKRVFIKGYEKCPVNEFIILKELLQRPMAVTICAGVEYADYKKGDVYDRVCHELKENPPRLEVLTHHNHCGILKGYDMESLSIQNSWGANWGDKGSMRLKRTKDESGQCGIFKHAYYPITK